jgi:hypothetical protein
VIGPTRAWNGRRRRCRTSLRYAKDAKPTVPTVMSDSEMDKVDYGGYLHFYLSSVQPKIRRSFYYNSLS